MKKSNQLTPSELEAQRIEEYHERIRQRSEELNPDQAFKTTRLHHQTEQLRYARPLTLLSKIKRIFWKQ